MNVKQFFALLRSLGTQSNNKKKSSQVLICLICWIFIILYCRRKTSTTFLMFSSVCRLQTQPPFNFLHPFKYFRKASPKCCLLQIIGLNTSVFRFVFLGFPVTFQSCEFSSPLVPTMMLGGNWSYVRNMSSKTTCPCMGSIEGDHYNFSMYCL